MDLLIEQQEDEVQELEESMRDELDAMEIPPTDEVKRLMAELGVSQPKTREECIALQNESRSGGHLKASYYTSRDAEGNKTTNASVLDYREIHAKAVEVHNKKRKAREERITYVKRAAFTQDDIFLSDPVPDQYLQQLFDSIMEPYLTRMNLHASIIRKRLYKNLKSFIPMRLLNAYRDFPQSVIKDPGFVCRTPNGGVFWAELDFPAYIDPGEAYELAKTQHANRRMYDRNNDPAVHFDKEVDAYTKAKRIYMDKLRTTYAHLTKYNEQVSYIDILRQWPLWFDTLYTIVTNKVL